MSETHRETEDEGGRGQEIRRPTRGEVPVGGPDSCAASSVDSDDNGGHDNG
ncbi:MAG: hypothetical protein ACRBK7_23345 [Acidimicrobiales bacterium]